MFFQLFGKGGLMKPNEDDPQNKNPKTSRFHAVQ